MQQNILKTGVTGLLSLALLVTAIPFGLNNAFTSSHREAPLISMDPTADQTDLYAYVSSEDEDNVVLVGNYSPLIPEGVGPNFHDPDTGVLYAFHIDNDGDAIEDITYAVRFRRKVKNGNTFLYNTQPVLKISDSNVTYVADVYKIMGKFNGRTSSRDRIATGLKVAPPVIGKKSQPNYENLAAEAISRFEDGGKIFMGQRDDPFFVDLELFNLLNLGGGKDSLAGANVFSIVMEIPKNKLTKSGEPIIGVWGTTSRRAFRTFRNGKRYDRGKWTQISRLGMPLVNEGVVPLAFKDFFNSSHPSNDADTAAYAQVILNSELGGLLNAVLGLEVPQQERQDIFQIFLQGVPDLNRPKNVRPAEMLRLNTSIAPATTPNRMGVLGGDIAGFPNGRRLGDDVTDITVQVVLGVLAKTFGLDFEAPEGYAAIGDGVDANDRSFSKSFPYLASPVR
ncbi:MAG: DUF4331 domain-containing protein [Candidatus Gracilibacteria bacterium]|nr:DUF4331 domain-containing protein [Candidatus Gracilibacteria bacterium]